MTIAALASHLERLEALVKAKGRLPLWRLDDAERAAYQRWRNASKAAIADYEAEHGKGASYAAGREGNFEIPDMPEWLRKALDLEPTPAIPVGATTPEAAQIYRGYVECNQS
ncbi:hypothetical protein [Seohaeicola zhoushanensis]|uniref:Uncharacterized protein n=1 Tax=Seohaeicola zhoushanensis TaxID=1569283 RepID=A0A8J3M8P7_9RHOB|nr:hypothetical protein [Seohaeicola zhoushanensis]GHF54439.1 hypothetical protein GCM10017056_27380 [Seohaeicola zhoushanensis]